MTELEAIFAALAVVSLVLTLWRWATANAFPLHRRPPAPNGPLPGITFLKPLKGCNAETQRCLRSWFRQAYPGPLQILFGVADAGDPVCQIVRDLIAEFPGADAHLVICGEKLGASGKVSKLQQLEPLVRHPFLMVSDADVEVPPHFALAVAPRLMEPGVGLVNCFYRLANPATMAMRWEAIAINADFWSQVLQARSLGPVDFALGAVMSLPGSVLRQIGGFAHLADYLADDYELGQSVARTGQRIRFANIVVDCREAPAGWGYVWRHQLRWARTIRSCRPVAYFLSILGNPTLWPLAWLAANRTVLAAAFFAAAILVRMVSAAQQQQRLAQSAAPWAWCWFAPIKDLLDFLIWTASFWGNHVEWRGERYRIVGGGKLLRVASQIDC